MRNPRLWLTVLAIILIAGSTHASTTIYGTLSASSPYVWNGAWRGQPYNVPISTSTFTPNFDNNQNFEIDLTTACPCTVANPSTTLVAGQSGVIEIHQVSSGSAQTIGTWGSEWGNTGSVNISSTLSSVTYVSYYVDNAATAIQLNAASSSGGLCSGCAPTASPTFTGTVTMPDSSTWTSSGIGSLAALGIGTAATTQALVADGTDTSGDTAFSLISGTLATSNTGSVQGVGVTTTVDPTGASLSAGRGMFVNPTITGSISPTTFEALNVRPDEAGSSAFTGTVGTGYGIRIQTPTLNSEAAMTAFDGIGINSITNGSGNTSGTIQNDGILINNITAVAGVGGTIDNYSLEIVVPSGIDAGTMVNRGIYLHGSFPSGGATSNYAIDNESGAQIRTTGLIDDVNSTASTTTSSGALIVTGGSGIGGAVYVGGLVDAVSPVRASHGYTVATLPAAGTAGRRAYVTDQLTACVAAGAALTGGGAVVCPVFDNGTAWVGD
jgi:hypothetical protein